MITNLKKKLAYASVGMAALILVGCGSAEDRAKTYYESGNTYLQQKDYTKAAIEFRNALKLKEDYADAWFGMAKIEEKNENWPRVVGNLNKVLEIQPKHLQALENLSKFLLLAGDLATSLKHANTAYGIEPQNPNIISLRAAVLLKMNDRDNGIVEAKKALAIQPNHPDATILIAADQLEAKQLDSARNSVDEALKANPESLGLLLLRIRIAELGGNRDELENSIRALSTAFPERQEFKDSLANFLVKSGRKQEAEQEYRKSITGADDLEGNKRLVIFLRMAYGDKAARDELVQLSQNTQNPFPYQIELTEIDYQAGKKEEALTALRELAQKQGISDNGIVARVSLAQKLLEQKQFDELEKVLAEIISNDARNVSALKIRGAMNLERGNTEQALNDLREALNFDQNDPTIRLLLANTYERRSSFDLATKELLDAYRNSKGNADVGLAYAGFLLRRGSFDRAEVVLAEVFQTAPRNREVLALLADLRLRKGDWEGAEELAKMVKEQAGDAEFSEKIMGTALAGQGRFEEAIGFFQRAAQASPQDIQPMFNLVRAYVGAGKMAEAEAFAKSLLEASPGSANANIVNGAVHLAMKRVPEAKAAYEKAVAVAPQDPASHLALSEFYQTQSDLASSIKVLTAAESSLEQNTDIRMQLAGLLERDGKQDDAINLYEKIVKANPGAVVAVNNLVSLLTDYRDDPETLKRATEMAAVLRDSPIPHFRETLGWSLVRQGSVKQGLPILEKTISQLENVSAAQYHLGMAYAADGAKSLAAKHLKIALDLEKDVEIRDRIKRALELLGPEATP